MPISCIEDHCVPMLPMPMIFDAVIEVWREISCRRSANESSPPITVFGVLMMKMPI